MRKTYGDIHTAQEIINMMNIIILEEKIGDYTEVAFRYFRP